MKRELAFALESLSQYTSPLGRTRASKAWTQSDDLNGVSEDRSSKKFKGSGDLNGEIEVSQEKPEINASVNQNQENKIVVYRRTRRFRNSNPEFQKNVSQIIKNGVRDKSNYNLAAHKCDEGNKGELTEASIKKQPRIDSQKTPADEECSDVVPMKIDASNEVMNDENNEVSNAATNEVRNNENHEVKGVFVIEASRKFVRSALNSDSEVEHSAKISGGVENKSVQVIDGSVVGDLGTPTKNVELKTLKKIALETKPRTVKELFATGLLEGHSVFYNGGNKGFSLRGMIKEVGILCFCSSCKGSKVVNPCKFEIHACKSYRRAAQYICLENGVSLLQVLKACRSCPLDVLEETIQSAIGPLPEKEPIICQNCKGFFLAALAAKVQTLCQLCDCLKNSEATPIYTSVTSAGSVKPVSALRKSTRSAKLVIASRDQSQGRITNDRSLDPSSFTKSRRSCSTSTLSQIKSQGKIVRRCLKLGFSPKSPGRASLQILSHMKCQGRIMQKGYSRSVGSSSVSRLSKSALVRKSYGSASNKSPLNLTKKLSKAVLVSRSSGSASLCFSPQKKSQWKITKKDQGLHKLVFEDGGLPDGTEVAYYIRGQKLLVGYIRGLGILCHCCNSEVSPSQFEAHAGCASRKKPYGNIYTSNGVSLHEFAVSLLRSRKYSVRDNDDLCIICADGGNLLLCDGCPRAFHRECASLTSIPRGKWYCKYCQNMFQREKFVEHNVNAVAAGRVSGVDPIEQITKRCIRIVENPEDAEIIACVLCRGYDFKSGFGPRTVIVCDQCEKEYHVGCLKKHKLEDLKELPKEKWFCCTDCGSIYSALKNLLIRGEEKIPGSLLDVIKKKHEDKVSHTATEFDVKWRVLSGKVASPETRVLLSKAVAIFHECFDPIVDSTTGRDFIPSMVYGRKMMGQDFGGMYCAVLMVNSRVASAGIFRVFGCEIAELPLVATRIGNQGKGYFQMLFSCIEKLLASLRVKSLVLPAAEEAESIWTRKFNFERIPPEQLSKYRKTCWQMLSFKGTSMLQKLVPQMSN